MSELETYWYGIDVRIIDTVLMSELETHWYDIDVRISEAASP